MEFHFFDPSAGIEASQRHLPHWEQLNAYYFITWRTADSIPANALEDWHRQRAGWLDARGIDPEEDDWQRKIERLPETEHREFYRRFTHDWHEMLDGCQGECLLRKPELSQVVADNLLHLHGQAYELEAFVVMPNHVHVVAGIPGRGAMKTLCRNWKHYTGRRINEVLERKGQFWQWESFDHLVRSPASLAKFRQYIADNPQKARLKAGEYRLWVK